jgi:hypothetical protein
VLGVQPKCKVPAYQVQGPELKKKNNSKNKNQFSFFLSFFFFKEHIENGINLANVIFFFFGPVFCGLPNWNGFREE